MCECVRERVEGVCVEMVAVVSSQKGATSDEGRFTSQVHPVHYDESGV